jgi:hypothetical protein
LPNRPVSACVGRVAAPRQQALVVDEQVVEDQELLAMHGAVRVGARRLHEDVAVQPEILLHVLAHVRVIPVDAPIRKPERIGERAAGLDRRLGEIGHAVEPRVEPEAVPVHGGGHRQRVPEPHRELGALRQHEQRARILAVEPEHGELAARDDAADDTRREVERIAGL